MNIKGYLKYAIIYILLQIVAILLYKNLFNIDEKMQGIPRENSIFTALDIILNNLKNFLMYIILFPIMPVLWSIDFLTTSWSIYVSIELYGVWYTVDKLLPHALIEVPNYLLYSYISFLMMKEFYRNFKEILDVKFFLKYRKILLLNVLLIVISGLVEGLIT